MALVITIITLFVMAILRGLEYLIVGSRDFTDDPKYSKDVSIKYATDILHFTYDTTNKVYGYIKKEEHNNGQTQIKFYSTGQKKYEYKNGTELRNLTLEMLDRKYELCKKEMPKFITAFPYLTPTDINYHKPDEMYGRKFKDLKTGDIYAECYIIWSDLREYLDKYNIDYKSFNEKYYLINDIYNCIHTCNYYYINTKTWKIERPTDIEMYSLPNQKAYKYIPDVEKNKTSVYYYKKKAIEQSRVNKMETYIYQNIIHFLNELIPKMLKDGNGNYFELTKLLWTQHNYPSMHTHIKLRDTMDDYEFLKWYSVDYWVNADMTIEDPVLMMYEDNEKNMVHDKFDNRNNKNYVRYGLVSCGIGNSWV